MGDKRVQKTVDRCRKAARKCRKEAGKSTGAKRAAYLKDAKEYENEANRLVSIFRNEGVK